MSSDPKWFEERAKALAEGDTWPRTKKNANAHNEAPPVNPQTPINPNI